MLLRLTRPALLTAYSRGEGGDVYARAHALLAGDVLRARAAGPDPGLFDVPGLGWVQLPSGGYEVGGDATITPPGASTTRGPRPHQQPGAFFEPYGGSSAPPG